MRTLKDSWKLLLAAVALAVLASPALAQPPGGGKGGYSKGSGMFGGAMSSDPTERFKKMANGKDHIVISELQGFFRSSMETYAKENGITNGKLTLDQYLKFSENQKARFTQGGGGFFKGPQPPGGAPPGGAIGGAPSGEGGRPTGGGPPPGKGPGNPPPGKGPGGSTSDKGSDSSRDKGSAKGSDKKEETPEEFEARVQKEAERYFKERDENKDGYLTTEEMSRTLRDHYKKFDKNNDNKINFDEAKEYIRAFLKRELSGNNSSKGKDSKKSNSAPGTEITIDLSELEERPVVYTGGKLPDGLPEWFAKLDTDKDGQIGLYEWIAAKKELSEFRGMDLNQDGFLTPGEVLMHQQMAQDYPGLVAAVENSNSAPTVNGETSKGKTPSPANNKFDFKKSGKGGFKR